MLGIDQKRNSHCNQESGSLVERTDNYNAKCNNRSKEFIACITKYFGLMLLLREVSLTGRQTGQGSRKTKAGGT